MVLLLLNVRYGFLFNKVRLSFFNVNVNFLYYSNGKSYRLYNVYLSL